MVKAWPTFQGPVILPYIFKDYFMDQQQTLGKWVGKTQPLTLKHICHNDLYFMVQWFQLISWRLMDQRQTGKMSQWDTTFDLETNIGHNDLYFMVHWSCLISWRLFDGSQWPIFHGPLILPYILKTIWWINIKLWEKWVGVTSFYLITNIGHSDLYFMVQWFCLISWNTIWWMNKLSDNDCVAQTSTQNKYRSCWPAYISWSSEFTLYLFRLHVLGGST